MTNLLAQEITDDAHGAAIQDALGIESARPANAGEVLA
jgi:hypothetical protein